MTLMVSEFRAPSIPINPKTENDRMATEYLQRYKRFLRIQYGGISAEVENLMTGYLRGYIAGRNLRPQSASPRFVCNTELLARTFSSVSPISGAQGRCNTVSLVTAYATGLHAGKADAKQKPNFQLGSTYARKRMPYSTRS